MSTDQVKLNPMDIDELRPCAVCGKGVMHTGSPVFYELNIASCVVDLKNVQRMHGLEQMMGGATALARVFSPSNVVAQRMPADRVLLCSECAGVPHPPLRFVGENGT
ncbi:hypothetical protein [Ciceribacter sp. L1K22]|uniref:hypothetical protein n=1 Tax=Ciceribacter sp. L1K22 TaxID=2820275 RepID=UPI001ABDF4FB|nr:hypothetical protein [Ciceribacter sp. L1K22]MBO3760397.1 hypothetical protein [Ciceribacter sp. L1K22]